MKKHNRLNELRKKYGRVDNTIPDDVTRRRKLNSEMNAPEEYEIEATQKINPLTGRKYDSLQNLRISLEENYEISLCDIFEKKRALEKILSGNTKNYKPETNDFIEYQFALASMEVHDGKLSGFVYRQKREQINEMVKRMNDANVPISLISNVHSFNDALAQIDRENYMDRIYKKIYIDEEKESRKIIYEPKGLDVYLTKF